MNYKKICVVFGLIGLLSLTILAQSGGTFVIQKSVIASGGDRSSGGTFVVQGTIGQTVTGTQSNGGTFSLTSGFWSASATQTVRRASFDYDGDNKTDLSIFRPAPAEWWYLRSSDGGNRAFQFGSSTDKIVPADYTGDGKTDVAFWRPSNGNWFVLRSEDFSFFSFPFGANGDVPVAGDYDGDRKFDAGVFRPTNQTWFVNRSTAGTLIQNFGISGDIPTPNVFVP